MDNQNIATHFPVHQPVPFTLNKRYLTPYYVKGCGPTGASLQIPTQRGPGVSGTTHFLGTFSLVYFRSPASKWTIKKCTAHFPVHPPVPFTLNERYLTPYHVKGCGPTWAPLQIPTQSEPGVSGTTHFLGTFSLVYFRSPASK